MNIHFFYPQIIFHFVLVIVFTSCSGSLKEPVNPKPTPITTTKSTIVHVPIHTQHHGNEGCFTDTIVAPHCIKERMHCFLLSACPTGAYVREYSFQNQMVYAFGPGNCEDDTPATIRDSTCMYLGPFGGFTRNMNINGENFESNAVLVRTIWSN